jgi:hypothetical protein
MKKILLIAAVAGLAMASCKKDRTCSCTITSTPPSGAAFSSTVEYTVEKVSKAEAKDGMCRSFTDQTTAPVAGTKYEKSCELK